MLAENPGARERDRQALRLRRYGMAAATSLMVIALLWVAYWLGDLTWRGVTHGTALILFWVVLFYVLLRSGINLRLSALAVGAGPDAAFEAACAAAGDSLESLIADLLSRIPHPESGLANSGARGQRFRTSDSG